MTEILKLVPPDAAAPRHEEGPAWLRDAIADEKGKPLANLANAMLAMREDERLKDSLSYDEMGCMSLLNGKPIRDSDITEIQEYLQRAGLRWLSKDNTHSAVELKASERSFHPVRDYLSGLIWDGDLRLSGWLSELSRRRADAIHCRRRPHVLDRHGRSHPETWLPSRLHADPRRAAR